MPEFIGDASGLPHLIAAMHAAGYGDTLIRRLCRDNWPDLLRRVIGYAVLLFANIPGETRAAPGSGAAPPVRLRVYQKANLSENYPLWNRHKRKRPRSRVPPSSASARCGWRWNTAMSIRAKRLALTAIAGKLGCSPDSLRVWMRQVQRDGGERSGQTRAKNARITELEREVRELRQGEEGQKTIRGIVFPTNEILRKASAYFAQVRKVMRRCFSIAWSGSTARFANSRFRFADRRFIEESRNGLVANLCRSECSFMPPYVRKPRGFCLPMLNADGAGYRSR